MSTFPFRVIESDAVPDGTLMMLVPHEMVRVTMPDGREVTYPEPMEQWARRCAVLRIDADDRRPT
jgi:hypothetical protein